MRKNSNKIWNHQLYKTLNSYILPLICLVLFIILNFFDFKIYNSNGLDKIMQSTITLTSIILGFFGTLLGQILSTLREEKKEKKDSEEKLMSWYFNTVNIKVFTNKVLLSILNGVLLLVISLVVIAKDAYHATTLIILWYFWLFLLLSFLTYQFSIYKVFIKLIFYDRESNNPEKVSGAMTEEECREFNRKHSACETQSKNGPITFKINERIKK